MNHEREHWLVRVTTDGRAQRIPMEGDGLRQMQEIVGGYIERVAMSRNVGYDIWVNEEGAMEPVASRNSAVEYLAGYRPLYGDAVLTDSASVDGETNGLSAEDAERIVDMLR